MLHRVKVVAVNVYDDINKNHTLAFAASLSYYFVLSLFPAMIAMAAVLGFHPFRTSGARRWISFRASCRRTAWDWCAGFCRML